MKKVLDKDAYGKGLLAYMDGKRDAKFTVYSDLAETEKWDIATFFRGYEDMPQVERVALDKCVGNVLDAGAGTGSHALWLQQRNHRVTAIDISEGAVEVMKRRGVVDASVEDFFRMKGENFHTILMLMNGAGIVQRIDRFGDFFMKAKELLADDGCIIMDSSNILYMFMEEDGSALIDLNGAYYGEMRYRMDFGKAKGETFDWIFIDFDTLSGLAAQYGFTCEKVFEDDHHLYLAELRVKK